MAFHASVRVCTEVLTTNRGAKANSGSSLHPSVRPVFHYLPLVLGLFQVVLIEEGGLCILGPPGHSAGKDYTLLLVSGISQAHASAWA